ncbi:MAG: hypothetical protein IKP41_00085 [Bacteroidaceae bacterium]|nr:hypothetical protein [Bacteroidaceae bacterium]
MKTKILFVFLIFFFSLTCMGQDKRIYTGEGTLYHAYEYNKVNVYVAHICEQEEELSNKYKYADKITLLYSNGGEYSQINSSSQISSSHGEYISFKIFAGGARGLGACEQFLFISKEGGEYCCYAFVIEGTSLCIVDVMTDEVVSILDDKFHKADDFEILVQHPYVSSPSFYIMNDGFVNIYKGFDEASSIKSRQNNAMQSNKTYNLSGIEVDPSNEKIFIQDGKVRMNTKKLP